MLNTKQKTTFIEGHCPYVHQHKNFLSLSQNNLLSLFVSALTQNNNKTKKILSLCLFSQNDRHQNCPAAIKKVSKSPSRGKFFLHACGNSATTIDFYRPYKKKVENFCEVNECVNTKSVNLMGLWMFQCILR